MKQSSESLSCALIASCLLTAVMPAHAATYADLQADWSNASNPTAGPWGSWTYLQGNTPLPYVPVWIGGPFLGGWGPAANQSGNFLPFFCKAHLPEGDTLAGDVFVHTTDGFNGGPNGPASFLWTSGVTATVTIKGAVWPIRNIGRLNDFSLVLTHNGTLTTLTTGLIPEDGSVTRCNPIAFSFSGQSISNGDTLRLTITQAAGSHAGDFAAVRLFVTTDACPRPGDLNGDGYKDGQDIQHFVDCLLIGNSACADCACADMNGDGFVTGADMTAFVAGLL